MYKDFQELPVWRDAMRVAIQIFDLNRRVAPKRRLWINVTNTKIGP